MHLQPVKISRKRKIKKDKHQLQNGREQALFSHVRKHRAHENRKKHGNATSVRRIHKTHLETQERARNLAHVNWRDLNRTFALVSAKDRRKACLGFFYFLAHSTRGSQHANFLFHVVSWNRNLRAFNSSNKALKTS